MRCTDYLFDLDGTLTDPGQGIKNSIRYALQCFGLPPLDETTLNRFIGPPLLNSFEAYCGVSSEDAGRLLRLYREYFSEQGIFENVVYKGIPEALRVLCDRGARIHLATGKPEPYAKRILEHFELTDYFTFIGGSTMNETRTDKSEIIAYVLESARLSKNTAVMVGDRIYDIQGGKKNGVLTVGVLYGYGDEEELKEADILIREPTELLTVAQRNNL